MSRTPSLFLYPGSKRHLQQHILPKLSDLLLVESGITTYCEPFFGGGGLGLAFLSIKPPITKVVLNDRDCGVAATWTAVIRYPNELIERVKEFQPTVQAFERLNEFMNRRKATGGHEGVVELGFANLALHRLSLRGKGTRAGSPRGGRQQQPHDNVASRWKPELIASQIKENHDLLTSFDVDGNCCHSFDFQRVLETDKRMLTFVDPPHHRAGQNFYHIEFTEDDHYRLQKCLKRSHHKWLLTYDSSPVIRKMYLDWTCVQEVLPDYRNGAAETATEFLITPKPDNVLASKPKARKKSEKESQEVPQVKATQNHDASPDCQRLNTDDIRLDEALHARVDMRQDVIEDYAQRMLAGDHFPPRSSRSSVGTHR